ncbi:MarR family winged helix-turn-helix transcriptional regulator [Roseibium sp. SCPC15]|uniref:MarR family winged helix-turn-helix transcriptional regulator n=1 Tax=Roseibium sp. SCP15 TaxID=3141376 RepID=UPI003337C0A6
MKHGAGMKSEDLVELMREVRKTFRLLAGISDTMLEGRGLTASLRAILEFIADNGPSTVPQMAAAKSMKRQSIQAFVDRLLVMGLVETAPNPAHKRSVLIALTEKGAAEFRSIRTEETLLLEQVAARWAGGDAELASQTLKEFRRQLSRLGRDENETDIDTQP